MPQPNDKPAVGRVGLGEQGTPVIDRATAGASELDQLTRLIGA
jgi:hypothetical protein